MLRLLRIIMLSLPLLAAGAAVAGPAPTPEETVSATTFVVRGRGWGHGVGMGQWGAFGQAKRGIPYTSILAHYYPGTELTKVKSGRIRVLLLEGAGPYSLSSDVPLRVEDGGGATYDVDPGTYRIGKGLSLPIDGTRTRLEGPLTFRPGSEPLAVGGRSYRGAVVFQRVGKRLQVVNLVGLDAYTRGVVTEEVPDDWPLEAIKAQAVAARSYGLAAQRSGSIIYADTRSQVYNGIGGESTAGDRAVAATAGQILTFGGKVATTFYYSSSGGRTANVKDAFAGAQATPYLVSVPDPDDTLSPYHRWGPITFPATRVSKRLGVAGTSDMRTVPATGRAREVIVTGRAGDERIPASTVRFALELRSTWITIGALTLSRPKQPLAAGGTEALTGTIRGVKGPIQLQQRTGGSWETVGDVKPAADGSFSVEIGPTTTTPYRLTAADGVIGPALRVPVSPARRLAGRASLSSAVERSSAAFAVNDPLAASQWHLARIRAFDYWPVLPALAPVPVAVIDTGVDLGHPDLAGRVIASRSFVGGSVDDTLGHGTFVAGLIAATVNNAEGIAGIAFPAQLIVAKVADPDGDIDAGSEAQAIRWAVSRGARVINLSLGGLRDPVNRSRDTFSQAEADAIAYARSKGVVVVAAVGNGDSTPRTPWRYADYPAALPHVIGVSAIGQSGSVPRFSNRDAVFNDLAAPGQSLVSTLPRKLTAPQAQCVPQGYSPCGPADYRDGSGTSFAAAQVSAAAALLLAARPDLAPDQVATVIERAASDANSSTGCPGCPLGRDALSGWGTLDVTAALQALALPLPTADRHEPNDDAGSRAATLYGTDVTAQATLDFWDDQTDVYRVKLRAGDRLKAVLRGPQRSETRLALWRPGTEHVEGLSPSIHRRRVAQSSQTGPNQVLSHWIDRSGWYFLQAKMTKPGSGAYTLRIEKAR
jgi:stage II sporulation protein D